MAGVTYEGATRHHPGTERPAVDRLDLDVADGEVMVLVGPPGCGKSTSLRMLAGLEDVDAGRVLIGDRDVTDAAHEDRDIAVVFQNNALYPHMTVGQNMGFSLAIAGLAAGEIRTRVAEAGRLLDLTQLLDRKPTALSGGQRQRVALGRALVRRPQVFLMDEPLAGLDAKLRVSTRPHLADLQRELGVTTVYVTRDPVEAMTMGHRVAVLRDGVLVQVGSPRELHDRPVDVFVAGFLGSPPMNLITAPVVEGRIRLGGRALTVPTTALDAATDLAAVTVGVRPESLRPAVSPTGFVIRVQRVEELGVDALVHGFTEVGGRESRIVLRTGGRRGPAVGDVVELDLDDADLHLFDTVTGRRLVD